ncbi:hypothetical protein [Pseudonocardia sp.]|uniref:hypothetical protein n=1 Tax=Pseudonocardia sp. TaxID=60912 RepID=UPI003D0A90C3
MTMTEEPSDGHPLGAGKADQPGSARETINRMLDAGLLDEVLDCRCRPARADR